MVATQIVMSMSFTFLSPVLPLFLPELGVTTETAVDLWSGGLASVTSFVAVFTSPIWGRMSDRYGRKLMVLRSAFAIGACTALMGLALTPWHLLAARVLMGAFAGFSSASVVLIASQVPERRLGSALGYLSAGQLVGSLLGPVFGGAMADLTGSYRMPFFLAASLSMVGFVVCLVWVPEKFVRPTGPAKRQPSMLKSFRVLTRVRGMSAMLMVLLLTQFGVMAIQPVISLYVLELVGQHANLGTLGGLAFSATGLAGIVAVPLLGRWSDRLGERHILLIALIGAALTTVPQAFAGSYWVFVLERFGVGLFVGAIIPMANAMIGKMMGATDRGFVFGLTSSAYFLGNSLGPLTGGVVGAAIGLRWVFLVTAALLAMSAAWVYRGVRA